MSEGLELLRPRDVAGYKKLSDKIWRWKTENPYIFKTYVRAYARSDLYFLLRYVLQSRNMKLPGGAPRDDGVLPGSRFFDHPWVFDRVRDVEANHHRVLDIWSRGSGKSTIKSYGLPIMWILNDPQARIHIASENVDKASKHVQRIKIEFTKNKFLRWLFKEYFSDNPKDHEHWKVKEVSVLRPGSAMIEPTVKAVGITSNENIPVGDHATHQIFDDPFGKSNSYDEELVEASIENYHALKECVHSTFVRTFHGTFYSDIDGYLRLVKMNEIEPAVGDPNCPHEGPERVWPGVNRKDCQPGFETYGGRPYLLTIEQLKERLRDPKRGAIWYNRQILCDRELATVSELDESLMGTYTGDPRRVAATMSLYLVLDPAGGGGSQALTKDENRDDAALLLVGYGGDENFYLLDAAVDLLGPDERAEACVQMHKDWCDIGRFVELRIEEVGAAQDVHNVQTLQRDKAWHFKVVRVYRGGQGTKKKKDRIFEMVQPRLSRIFLPPEMVRRRRGRDEDLVAFFRRVEVNSFPRTKRDNMLDALTLIFEPPKKAINEINTINELEKPDPNLGMAMLRPPPDPLAQVHWRQRWMVSG